MRSIRVFFVFVALFASLEVQAQAAQYPLDLPLSWDNATSFDNGAPMTTTDLVGIHVSCVRNADTAPVFTSTVPALAPGSTQAEVFVGVIPQPGNYTCVAYSITDQDFWSLPSNEAIRRYTGNPNSPTNFKFTTP